MKSVFSLVVAFSFLFSIQKAQGQVTVVTGQAALDYAQIVAGAGVTVSNASIIGSPDAIGSFSSVGPTGFGVQSGILLASGNVVDAPGTPATFAGTGLGTPGDPYLENIISGVTNDAVILEFDFVPNADFVSFDFVFGSEEYDEYVCDEQFFDVFALTIEGVSVGHPLTNMAIVPGTTLPIGINSINNGSPGSSTTGTCDGPNESLAYAQYYNANTGTSVVYDGFTIPMIAEANVLCGETYRLRFMIADGGDSGFDSVVFVEENSLTTGNVTIQAASLGGDTAAIEGCADLEITLTLNGDPPLVDVPVSVWIGGGSTAEWGVDYDPVGVINQADSTVVIPAGSNTVSFTISPIVDNIPEGIETIDLVAITSTCGTIDTFNLFITEVNPLEVQAFNDTTICTGNAILWANATGGGGGFTYTWDNGEGVADTIFPSPAVTTTYTVTATDGCGSTPAVDEVLVTVDDGPTPNAGNDVFVCIGGAIVMNATSDAPGSTFLWNPATDLSDPTIANPICTPTADIVYTVTVTRPDGCSNDDDVMVTLTPPPTSEFNLPAVGCAGEPLVVDYAGNANAAAQFLWNFNGGVITNGSGIGPIAVYWPAPGIYDIDLTVSWNGCISPNTVNQIEIIGPPPVDAGTDISFCSDDSGPIGSAPLGGVVYSWSPNNGVADVTSSQTTLQLNNPTHDIQVLEYVLTATEQGCPNTDTVQVVVFPTPTVQFAIPDGECFNVNSYDFLASGNFGPNATFDWNFGPVGFPATSNVLQPQGVIFNAPGPQPVSITVEDNSCISETFTANVDVFEMPIADFVFDINDGCEPLLVGFENQSYNGNSSIYNVWSFGNSSSSTQYDPSVVYEAGTYTVTLDVVTAEGCAHSVTQTDAIEVFEKPNALFEMNSQVLDILDPNVEVTNLSSGIVSSEYTFHPFGYQVNAMTAEFEYPAVGTYEISQIVTTANGCTDTIIGSLEVKPHYTFYIPNAFTPTEDRHNEVWIPQGESISEFNMFIYDRWDEELFQSSSLDEGWDGTYKGKLVQQGIYVYKIDVVDVLGEPHKYFGTFSLVR